MTALTIKNIPDNLYQQLKQSANLHHRSINREAIYCIEQMIFSHKTNAKNTLKRTEKLWEKTPIPPLTDDLIAQAKKERH